MSESYLSLWLYFGIFLVFSEFVLPGLVSVFVGLGALTVALILYFNSALPFHLQMTTWFMSSTLYIFSLRLLVMKYYISDQKRQNIDEDDLVVGHWVEVIESLSSIKSGRIKYGDSTWVAKTDDDVEIKIGEMVEVTRRENISWWVKRVENEEKEEC